MVAGFPCVSVSALNVDPKSFTDQKSATGAGFASIKNYIKNKRPQWCNLENVKTLLHSRKVDSGKRPIDIINSAMKSLGYRSMHDLANTATFGIPQSRSRVWMIFIRLDVLQRMTDPGSILTMFRSFQLKPCSLKQVLLEKASEELDSTQVIKARRTKVDLKWPEKFEAVRSELGAVSRTILLLDQTMSLYS